MMLLKMTYSKQPYRLRYWVIFRSSSAKRVDMEKICTVCSSRPQTIETQTYPSIFFTHKYRFHIYGAKGWDFINQHLAFQSGSGSIPSVPRSGSMGLQPQVEGRGSFNERIVRLDPAWGPIQTRDAGTPSQSHSTQSSGRGKYRMKKIKRHEVSFTEAVRASARPIFTVAIWKAGYFFIDADSTNNSLEENKTLQLCLQESYGVAVNKYKRAHPDADSIAIATKMEQKHSRSGSFLDEWKERVHGYLTFHTICRDRNKYSYSFP